MGLFKTIQGWQTGTVLGYIVRQRAVDLGELTLDKLTLVPPLVTAWIERLMQPCVQLSTEYTEYNGGAKKRHSGGSAENDAGSCA